LYFSIITSKATCTLALLSSLVLFTKTFLTLMSIGAALTANEAAAAAEGW
jgi:hypothetical protein